MIRINGNLLVKSCSASVCPVKHHVQLEKELCVMGLEGLELAVCVCMCVCLASSQPYSNI